ncbi:MAG: hypothetical protein R3F31_14385 [Verrucomicrobiales bacterium]
MTWPSTRPPVPATFTVTLDAPSGLTVTVDYATASGSATSGADLRPLPVLSLSPLVNRPRPSPSPSPMMAHLRKASETFTVDLSNAANATFLDASGTGTITDDDTVSSSDDDRPSLSIANIAVTEGTDTHAVFSLVLSNPSVGPLSSALPSPMGPPDRHRHRQHPRILRRFRLAACSR